MNTNRTAADVQIGETLTHTFMVGEHAITSILRVVDATETKIAVVSPNTKHTTWSRTQWYARTSPKVARYRVQAEA